MEITQYYMECITEGWGGLSRRVFGVVSHIVQRRAKYGWLAWLHKLPDVVVGNITGILPPVALAILIMLIRS